VNPRFTDQDVAALYCAMRDGICAVQAQSWRQRWLDFLFPERAAKRRAAAIALVYRQWQEARPAPEEPANIQPLNHSATAMALHMVRSQRRGEHYAPHVSVTVRDEGALGQPR
jgi:hypothetical protein